MFKKFINSLGGFAVKPDLAQARNDEEIILGASCDVSFPSTRDPNKVLVERRTRPRVIQHTESLSKGPKIYRDYGSGYVNDKDANDKLTYEQAKEMQAMPKPELEAKFGSELFIFKQARMMGVPVRTEN